MARISRKDFEVTPIVAYGLVFLLLVLGGLGLQKFWRVENALAADVITIQTEVASLERLSGDTQWEGRLEQSLALRAQVDAAIWQGPTTGVIAAELQQSLRRAASGLGYDAIQLRVDPEAVERDGAQVLSFEFAARAPDGKGIVSLFEAVAVMPKQVVIRDVDFSQNIRDRNRPRLAMGGIIPIRVVTPETQGAAIDGMTGLPIPPASQRQNGVVLDAQGRPPIPYLGDH